MEVRQEILQGSGWLMTFLRYSSPKLWEGDGTSEPVSDSKTRSPSQLTGINYLPLSWAGLPAGCGCLCHLGDPILTLMPCPQQRWGRSYREGGWSSPWQCPALPRVQSREATQPSSCSGHCWAMGDQRIKPTPQGTPQAVQGCPQLPSQGQGRCIPSTSATAGQCGWLG